MLPVWFGLIIFGWISTSEAVNPTAQSLWNTTWTDKLKRDLLVNYDKFSRPTEYYNTTTVALSISVKHLELEESKGVLTIFGWLSMKWRDDKLKWNPADYGNITVVHLADHEIWQPDIMIYNSATGSHIDHFGNSNAILSSNGDVIWVPPSQFPVFCELNMRLWPFDTQKCTLILGSWTYDGYKIDLADGGVSTELIVQNHEWEIVQFRANRNTKTYACCEEPYIDIQYEIKLKRRSPMYKAVVITPASVLILLTLASFWLPPQSGEKIFLNGINALIICLFLIYFATKLPTMADHVPLVVLFYSSTLLLVAFSMIISIIVINISRKKTNRPIPWFIKKLLDSKFGCCLGLDFNDQPNSKPRNQEELREHSTFDDNNEDHQHIIEPVKISSPHFDWIVLATAIDRIAFLIYCVLFIIYAVAYSL